MALRLKPETREALRLLNEQTRAQRIEGVWESWRPVPRAEPAPEKVYDTHTFDIYAQTWVDT